MRRRFVLLDESLSRICGSSCTTVGRRTGCGEPAVSMHGILHTHCLPSCKFICMTELLRMEEKRVCCPLNLCNLPLHCQVSRNVKNQDSILYQIFIKARSLLILEDAHQV